MSRWLARSVLAASTFVLGSSVEAAARWHVAQSGHFIVLGDGGSKQVRLVAGELERFREVFGSLVKLRVESGRPFLVLAAKDEESMRRLVPWYWERRGDLGPAWVVFAEEEKDWAVVRADLEQPTRVLYHEYVHMLARMSLVPLPLWLNDGLLGGREASRAGAAAGRSNRYWSARGTGPSP